MALFACIRFWADTITYVRHTSEVSARSLVERLLSELGILMLESWRGWSGYDGMIFLLRVIILNI
jgi:hypothetical protein